MAHLALAFGGDRKAFAWKAKEKTGWILPLNLTGSDFHTAARLRGLTLSGNSFVLFFERTCSDVALPFGALFFSPLYRAFGAVECICGVRLGVVMPCYEYFCEDCQMPFEIILTLTEYEKDKIKCPKCGGKHVHQEAAAFFVVTSTKS